MTLKHPTATNALDTSGKLQQSSSTRSSWDDFFNEPGVDLGPRHQTDEEEWGPQRRFAMEKEHRGDIDLDALIVADPQVMGGRRVFRGTRVPVEVLFENLADGMSLDEILAEYETLNRNDVVRVLQLTSFALATPAAA